MVAFNGINYTSVIREGDAYDLSQFIQSGSLWFNKGAAIVLAACTGKLDAVIALAEAGLSQSPRLGEALTEASKHHPDVARYLLKIGADVHTNEDAPIRAAVKAESADIVRLLIENGANVQIKNNELLVFSSAGGDIATVKELVKAGADISVKKYAPLRFAAKYCRLEIVSYLISDCECDPSIVIGYRDSNLKVKSWCRKYAAVKALRDSLSKPVPESSLRLSKV